MVAVCPPSLGETRAREDDRQTGNGAQNGDEVQETDTELVSRSAAEEPQRADAHL
jgi:hypothetical protein